MTTRELHQLIASGIRVEYSTTATFTTKQATAEIMQWAEETVPGFMPMYRRVMASFHACKTDRLGDAHRKRVRVWRLVNARL